MENQNNRTRGDQVLAALQTFKIEPVVHECRWPRIRNIIVDFSHDHDQKQVLFTAHYDAVSCSPGANDNASGVAVLLGLCDALRSTGIPIRVIFFDREEAWFRVGAFRLGLLGSLYYTLRNDLRNISAVYNLEFCGMGDVLAIWPVKGHESGLPAVRQVEMAAHRLGLESRSTHIPWFIFSSDHLAFRVRGIPSAITLSLLPYSRIESTGSRLAGWSFTRFLRGHRPLLPEPLSYIHTAEDTSSKLTEDSLQLMLSLLLELISCSEIPECITPN